MTRGLETKWSSVDGDRDGEAHRDPERDPHGDAYDAFVDAAAGGHPAQTRAWAPVAVAGRALAARTVLVRDAGRTIGAALVLRARAGAVLLPVAKIERGPVCADPADVGRVAAAIARSGRQRGIARVSVMPYWAGDVAGAVARDLASRRFKDVQQADGAHVVTLRVDLEGKTRDALFAGSEREALRRKLRQAEKAGARARRAAPHEIDDLERLHVALMSSQSKRPKPRAWFEALRDHVLTARGGRDERGAVFVCEHDGETIASLFASRHGTMATFVLGASTSAPRAFSKMAPAMAEAIRWAHASGCTTFDLGGVPADGDDDEKRAAIAQFKFDFAKTRVHLVAEHARWL